MYAPVLNSIMPCAGGIWLISPANLCERQQIAAADLAARIVTSRQEQEPKQAHHGAAACSQGNAVLFVGSINNRDCAVPPAVQSPGIHLQQACVDCRPSPC